MDLRRITVLGILPTFVVKCKNGPSIQRDNTVPTVIGISGSLRRGSFNTALLRAAVVAMPAGSILTIESIEGIPLYNGDVEVADGIPERAAELKTAIRDADGLLLATPEYNNSIPGVLKNAIDWLSRPSSDIKAVFGRKPVALIGASQGGFGTILSQNAWLPVLRTLGTNPWFGGRLMVSRAQTVFDEQGGVKDDAVKKQLEQFLRGFVEFVGA
jgi:chromate reductase, NAD(P)H dehydrogenase (quinone)